MESYRSTPPRWYISPSSGEIGEYAEKEDMKPAEYDETVIRDFLHGMIGGEMTQLTRNSPGIQKEVAQALDKELCVQDDGTVFWRDQHYGSKENAVKAIGTQALRKARAIQRMAQEMDYESFPGSSPMRKAVQAVKMLQEMRKNREPHGDSDPSDLPGLASGDLGPEEAMAKIQEALKQSQEIDDVDKKLMGATEAGQKGPGDPEKIPPIVERLLDGHQAEWLKVSSRLDQISMLKATKFQEVVPDPMGETERLRPIQDPIEIVNRHASELVYPKRIKLARLAERSALVRERIEYRQKKMLMYVILDASGSMDIYGRISKAAGVIYNRLKAVIREEAELFFRTFGPHLEDDERHIQTPHQAQDLMRYLRDKPWYRGGGTAIATSIRQANKRITELVEEHKFVRPELVVVTDGEDTVDLAPRELRGKLHAFILHGRNTSLENAARASGGISLCLGNQEDLE